MDMELEASLRPPESEMAPYPAKGSDQGCRTRTSRGGYANSVYPA